jgi:hypothetical protein
VRSILSGVRRTLAARLSADEVSCSHVREELAVGGAGVHGRFAIGRHINACAECHAYRTRVREQRQMLAMVLPVVPTLGLKASALAAAGIGGGAAGAGMGGGALGAGLIAKLGAGKLAAIAVVGATAAGGGIAATAGQNSPFRDGGPPEATEVAPGAAAPGTASGGSGGPEAGLGATTEDERDDAAGEDGPAEARRLAAEKRAIGGAVGAGPQGKDKKDKGRGRGDERRSRGNGNKNGHDNKALAPGSRGRGHGQGPGPREDPGRPPKRPESPSNDGGGDDRDRDDDEPESSPDDVNANGHGVKAPEPPRIPEAELPDD